MLTKNQRIPDYLMDNEELDILVYRLDFSVWVKNPDFSLD